jgi:predicted transcriptional regulator
MPHSNELSRRERQIMDILFARHEGTVNQVCEALPDPPTPMAVRRMMHILEEKGHLNRREQGREVVYSPREAKDKAGRSAFQRVLETFFGGSLEKAVASHLANPGTEISPEELRRLASVINQAKKKEE